MLKFECPFCAKIIETQNNKKFRCNSCQKWFIAKQDVMGKGSFQRKGQWLPFDIEENGKTVFYFFMCHYEAYSGSRRASLTVLLKREGLEHIREIKFHVIAHPSQKRSILVVRD